MDYIIKEVSLDDTSILNQVNNLIYDVFGIQHKEQNLILNTTTLSQYKSLYLAAFIEDEIIGFNAFIAHSLLYNNETIYAYQSCWTATSEKHRGKKIFQNLIEEAKIILKKRNAAFLFGFPNSSSYPIFIKKLKFREIKSLKLNLLKVGVLDYFYDKNNELDPNTNGVIYQIDEELINLKVNQYGGKIIKESNDDGLVWGYIEEKKIKMLKINTFSIGGVSVKAYRNIFNLLEIIKTKYNVRVFNIVVPENNTIVKNIRGFSSANTNNLIVFDLNIETENCCFNFLSGIKDVFGA
jgi:hypothetical protein